MAVECALLLLLIAADFAMRRHLDDGEERVANVNQLLCCGGGSKKTSKGALEEGLLADEQ